MSDGGVVLCEHPGCDRRGMGCWLPDDDEEPTDWLCDEHAVAAGYCASCRTFWAGIDSFDFSRTPGLCENCSAGEDYDDEANADEDDYERWCLNEDEADGK